MSVRASEDVLAWRVLRQVTEYREAWDGHFACHERVPDEPGPFRIRVQAEADRGAARFRLLAWEDPRLDVGRASPFWQQDGMVEGIVDPGAEPLAAMADLGGSVEGLRLLSGDLVVKVECGGAAVQVLVGGGGPFPDGAGLCIRHPFGLRMPHAIGRMVEFWSVAGRTAPWSGKGRRDG